MNKTELIKYLENKIVKEKKSIHDLEMNGIMASSYALTFMEDILQKVKDMKC